MKRTLKAPLALSLLLLLGGCAKAPEETTAPPVPAEPEQVTVTMFGYWSDKESDQAGRLAAAVNERYPEIKLEYEAFPTGAVPYSDELERRIAHGKEADMFMTANTNLWDSGKLSDITQQDFVGRYSRATMQSLSGDGAVYFLPGTGAVECYVYSSNVFSKAPQTLMELETSCREIKDMGGRPFLVPYEQTPALLMKAFASGYLASPEGQIWLQDYNEGKGSMADNEHWQSVWEMAERMIQDGILIEEDMVFAETRRIKMIGQGASGMSTISSSLLGDLEVDGRISEEFKLIPFVGETEENQTVFSAPTCYFAASAHLDQPGNETKRDAVMKILDFISTEEGQTIIRGTTVLSNSYMNDVVFSLDSSYKALEDALKRGSYGPAPSFDRGIEAAIGEVFGMMLHGTITAEEAMKTCDLRNLEYQTPAKAAHDAPVLGAAAEEFPWTFRSSRTQELAVTNFAIDSMRKAVGTEMAIELGTAVRGEFFSGEITDEDINSVIRSDKKLYHIEMTGQQLWDIIAQGVEVSNSSWFIVVSGLRYRYQPAQGAEPGVLLELTDSAGKKIEMDQTYDVAVSDNQMIEVKDVLNMYGTAGKEMDVSLRDAVAGEIRQQGTITPVLDGRIIIEQ